MIYIRTDLNGKARDFLKKKNPKILNKNYYN